MRYCRFLVLLLLTLPSILHAQLRTVPPELGGPGFEKIAGSKGWKTSTLSNDELQYLRDSTAVKGGEIRFALSEFPATLRSYGKDENTEAGRLVAGLVYEPLITTNPLTLDFLPALASHWKVDPDDQQTYWFRIDPNARFSDGHPVTTEDVLATYKLAIDSTILNPYTNTFYATFDPPEAISPYIFKVSSKEKNWKNMLYFGGTTILPAHIINGMSGKEYLGKFQYDMPPGSGPYILNPKDVEKQRSVTLTRRNDWWQQDYPINKGQYNFDKIKMVIVRDERLTLEKFKRGELDFYVISRAQWWNEEFNFDEVKRGLVQKRKVYTDQAVGISGFVFNMRKPPFDDERVREAFICLFNREQLLDRLMSNQYYLTDSYYPNSIYQNPNNPKYRYNPKKAGELLTRAGYTERNGDGVLVRNGEPFVVEMAVTEWLERILTPVQEDLMKAGIKLNLITVESYRNFRLLNERNFNIGWIDWGALDFPNPIREFHSRLADHINTNNLTGFKNAHADSLIELELRTFDQSKRVTILRELDSILMASKQYALAWYAPFTRIAYWNRFGHPSFYLGKISDWHSILSTWWVDPEQSPTVVEGIRNPTVTMPVGNTDVRFWEEWKKRHK